MGIIDVSEIHPGRNFSMVGIVVLGSLLQNAFMEAITNVLPIHNVHFAFAYDMGMVEIF